MSDKQKTVTSSLEHLALFAWNFVRHPVMLGSVLPSSPFLIQRLLRQVDWTQVRVVVEYGPGVGTFTREILRRLPDDAVLIALETNEDFVAFLRRSLEDPRLHIVHGSAAEVDRVLAERGLPGADCVISGIPFSTLPEEERERILITTRDVLQPQGALLVYQFSSRVLPALQRVFSSVRRGFEPLNVLPAQIFVCVP